MHAYKFNFEVAPQWLSALPVLLLAAIVAVNAAETSKKGGPSMVELVAGSTTLHRITLTQKAMERLDIKTGTVDVESGGAMVAPYAAVLYDVKGGAWVYTNPSPLVYVRYPIVVDSINGTRAVLKEGPPAGTVVVTVGAAELYGTEKGVGH